MCDVATFREQWWICLCSGQGAAFFRADTADRQGLLRLGHLTVIPRILPSFCSCCSSLLPLVAVSCDSLLYSNIIDWTQCVHPVFSLLYVFLKANVGICRWLTLILQFSQTSQNNGVDGKQQMLNCFSAGRKFGSIFLSSPFLNSDVSAKKVQFAQTGHCY